MYRINGYAYPVIAHKAMSPANQRGRRSVLRRRVIAKNAVLTRRYEEGARNLNVLLSGGRRGPAN